MIYLIPIEPYEIRYTEQWSRWFPEEFKRFNIEFELVEGYPSTNEIKDGCVLDVTGTNAYKFSQLRKLCSLIKTMTDKDTLFFLDLWFPGIEAIPYMCQQLGIRPKIAGIMHAGTYDLNDFTFRAGMNYWGKDLENSWFKFIDTIFVGSQYHKDLILQNRDCDARKIHVTGLPQRRGEILLRGKYPQPKENIVAFPHRTDKEKQPELFRWLGRQMKQYEFIVCRDVCENKEQYYQLLAKSKIVFSASLQETFGYGTLEGVTLGCFPVLPRRLCYPEMYPEECLYDSILEAGKIIDRVMEETSDEFEVKGNYKMPEFKIIEQAEKATERMIEVLA